MNCPNTSHPVWKEMVDALGENKAYYVYDIHGDFINDNRFIELLQSNSRKQAYIQRAEEIVNKLNPNIVNYQLKSVEILSNLTDKQKQDWNKWVKGNITSEQLVDRLQIPKEHKNIVLDNLDKSKSAEDVAVNIASTFSYTIEINIAKDSKIRPLEDAYYNSGLSVYDANNNLIKTFDTLEEAFEYKQNLNKNLKIPERNTQEHKELSAKNNNKQVKYKKEDGWEYQELSINTPLIENYKGSDHTPFTQFGKTYIGHIRVWYNKKSGEVDIQEVQSDLFQKSRDKENLDSQQEELKYLENIQTEQIELEFYNKIADLDFELSQGFITFEEYKKQFDEISAKITNSKIEEIEKEIIKVKKQSIKNNNFLQLLNKNNNWVKFFIRAIIQSTAKERIYEASLPDIEEKVLSLQKEGKLKIDCK